MVSRVLSGAVSGISAFCVEIEANQSAVANFGQRESMISVVGLPDTAVKESRDRIFSAFANSGFIPPRGFVVVNLAPADLKKEGASFDLGIALAILACDGTAITPERLAEFGVIGELGLDGAVRPVRGVLPIADMLSQNGKISTLLVPEANACEAALGAGGKIKVLPVANLSAAVEIISGKSAPEPVTADIEAFCPADGEYPDFAEVKGQALAKRALEIAAAGGHNLLMYGPPGTGKTMLAKRLPGIMPPMTREETLETSRIHSVLGMLSNGMPIVSRRPFRAPHHTVSDAGLIGGGRDPRPGEISLAHNGVLFLDELPEFKRNVLEVLRQPLECGEITVSRASGSCTFPASFLLCAAMNPCPCGRGDYALGCTCSIEEKRRYRRKISGPLLDRIDLKIPVRRLSDRELLNAPASESSAAIRRRVIAARSIQKERYRDHGITCNAHLDSKLMQKFCTPDQGGMELLRQAVDSLQLSPRSYDRILKVARTIADLAGSEKITVNHLSEAINYNRNPDF